MEELCDRMTMIHEDIRSKMTAISGLFLPLDGPIESRVESRQLFF